MEIDKLFNLSELKKEWEDDFENWKNNTLTLTKFEETLIENWTSNCLPRHMKIHDWNLPYAEGLLLILRRALKNCHYYNEIKCTRCGRELDTMKLCGYHNQPICPDCNACSICLYLKKED